MLNFWKEIGLNQTNCKIANNVAMKATYGEVLEPKIDSDGNNVGLEPIGREIFKDPITDDGTKKSKKGLLAVYKNPNTSYNTLVCYDQVSKEEESKGLLETVFKDGKLVKTTNLKEIRNKLNSYK